MATTIRDFTSPQRSPAAQVNPRSDRRNSVQSHLTAGSDNLRYRKASRANTVTTYREPEHPNWKPGAEPGIDTGAQDEDIPIHLTELKAKCEIKIVDFSESDVMESMTDNSDLASFLEFPRPEELPCRWISVNGLDWGVIRTLGNKYNLHRLAIEDLIHTHTRTKVDWYADHAFIVLTLQKLVRLHQHEGQDEACDCTSPDGSSMGEKHEHSPQRAPESRWWNRWTRKKPANILPTYLDRNRDGKIDEFVSAHSGISEKSPIRPIRTLHRYESSQVPEHTAWMERHSALAKEDLAVSVEQVSIFLLSQNCVVSFFEQSAEDVEEPIMHRLRSRETILRSSVDASLLTQAIIDAIVDLAVPVRDAYNKARKELQIDALTDPDIRTSRALHIFGEEIDMLQNLVKPIVHLVNALRDHHAEPTMPLATQTSQASQPPANPRSPSPDFKRGKARRDRDGESLMSQSISEFRRTAMTRTRTNTATSVTITPLAHTYFGDVLDHCITMISALEQMDASSANISTLIFNTVGAKTNNFMMILAIVTVFFAPLTFISGYFGMNFSSGNGLAHPFSFFWVVAIPCLVVFMLIVFATMLWDNIRDFFEKRGVQAHVRMSHKQQY